MKHVMKPRSRPSDRSRTLDIIERILRASSTALSVEVIVELAGNDLPTKSATPYNSVTRDLALDIKKHGDGSRFVRTKPGRFWLRSRVSS